MPTYNQILTENLDTIYTTLKLQDHFFAVVATQVFTITSNQKDHAHHYC